MVERKIPDRECLELCITGAHTTLMLMVELRKAGRHFSTSRSWSGDNDERAGRFNVIIFTVALVTDDQRDIFRIALNAVMTVDRNALSFQTPVSYTHLPADERIHHYADACVKPAERLYR